MGRQHSNQKRWLNQWNKCFPMSHVNTLQPVVEDRAGKCAFLHFVAVEEHSISKQFNYIREAFSFCLWERETFYLVDSSNPNLFFYLSSLWPSLISPTLFSFVRRCFHSCFICSSLTWRITWENNVFFLPVFISFIVPYNTVNVHPPNPQSNASPRNEVLTLLLLRIFHLAPWKKALSPRSGHRNSC